MKKIFILFCGLGLLFVPGNSFGAINTNPDGNRHLALAAVCFQFSEGDAWSCMPGSGVLASPQVILSNAHACPVLDEMKPAHLGFTFDEKITYPSKVYEVDQFICDPLFSATNTDTQDPHDLAVALLKEPVTDIRPFLLPPIIEFLSKGNLASTYFTVVDRGLINLTGWPDFPVWGDRRYGTIVMMDLRPGAVMLGPDPKHPVQMCYGASGAVALLTNTNIAVGIGSMFGDWTTDCQGPYGFTRLDTPQARDFLELYLPAQLLPK